MPITTPGWMQRRATADAASSHPWMARLAKIPRARTSQWKRKREQLAHAHTYPRARISRARVCVCECAQPVAHTRVPERPELVWRPEPMKGNREETGCRSIARRRFLSRTKVSNVPGVVYIELISCSYFSRTLRRRRSLNLALVVTHAKKKKKKDEFYSSVLVLNWSCVSLALTRESEKIDQIDRPLELNSSTLIHWDFNYHT